MWNVDYQAERVEVLETHSISKSSETDMTVLISALATVRGYRLVMNTMPFAQEIFEMEHTVTMSSLNGTASCGRERAA